MVVSAYESRCAPRSAARGIVAGVLQFLPIRFVFDSPFLIVGDERVHAATNDNLRLIFTQDYTYRSSTSGLFRPLTTLSYLVNYDLLGSGTPGWRWRSRWLLWALLFSRCANARPCPSLSCSSL